MEITNIEEIFLHKEVDIISQSREGKESKTQGLKLLSGTVVNVDPHQHLEIKVKGEGTYAIAPFAGTNQGISTVEDSNTGTLLYHNQSVDVAYDGMKNTVNYQKIKAAGEFYSNN